MNYKKIMIATAAIMTIGAATFVSCSKDSEETNNNNVLSGAKSGNSMGLGQLHNDMLAYAIEKFDETIEFNDVYEIVDYVRDINMTYIDEHEFDEETRDILKEMCEATKECVSTPDFYDSMLAGQYSFDRNVKTLHEAKLIEDFDEEQLMLIWDQIVKSYNQEISNEEVIDNIRSCAKKGMEGSKSMVANAIYDIALSSIEFWDENGEKPLSNEPDAPACYLPPQVVADAAGAAYSATVAAVGQYAVTGHVNGTRLRRGVTAIWLTGSL